MIETINGKQLVLQFWFSHFKKKSNIRITPDIRKRVYIFVCKMLSYN